MHRLLVITTTLGLLFSSLAMAQRPPGPGRQGPPPEAVEACASASAGDSCQFSGRRGEELQGTCEPGRDEELVCSPENAPKPG